MPKNILLLLLFICVFYTGMTQVNWDSTIYNLHKFGQKIGEEKYVITQTGQHVIYQVDFRFVDRGKPVPLTSTITLDGISRAPLGFTAKGSTSRMSVIDDSIAIKANRVFVRSDSTLSSFPLQKNSFPIAGYAPGTAQMLLLEYWKSQKRPATIFTLPSGAVNIYQDGEEDITFNNRKIVLNRYRISGLIWGDEWVWTDAEGHLYCLITNDAEGDKLEMMLKPYESLLPTFLKRTAQYSMRVFADKNKSEVPQPASKIIAIQNGNVVDVVNKTVVKNATVLIERGKIKRVTTAKFKLPADVQVIDATGKSILPGLWDMHAHFQQAEWGPAYLAAGITTVRDCGNEFDYINAVQKAIDEGKGIGPRILKAGIIDGKGPMALGVIQAEDATEAQAAVQRYKQNGFDQIKIYSSMQPAIVKAVCDEAKRLNLVVTGHIPIGMTLRAGIDSGMSQVNHISHILPEIKGDKTTLEYDLKAPQSDSVIMFLLKHKVVVDPTIGVYELIGRSLEDSITKIEPNFNQLPLPLQTLMLNTGMPSQQAARFKKMLAGMKALTKALYDRGVPIVAGTDMGMPGYSLYRELELYVEAGLTPMQALTTATIVPATVMKKQTESGSLTEGKTADLLIVDGDPTINISAVRKVIAVIKNGSIYDPVSLHKMVGFSK